MWEEVLDEGEGAPAGRPPARPATGLDRFDSLDAQKWPEAGPLHLAGALLRAPGPLIREIGEERRVARHIAGLLAIAGIFAAAYGAAVAVHALAWWAVVKVPLVLLGSALLCSPTLYVFNALLGSRLTGSQTLALVLLTPASASLILVALAPIVGFFGASTDGYCFMMVLHALGLLLALVVGLRVLSMARAYLAYLDGAPVMSGGLLAFWSLLVLVVGLQMAHYFRPILLPGPFRLDEPRGLFIDLLRVL